MDEEEDIYADDLEEEDEGSPFAVGGLDPAGRLSKITDQYEDAVSSERRARAEAAKARAERFRRAEEAIRSQRFGMPSQSEQLFALSAALLAPRRYKGFGATMSNVLPVLAQSSEARRLAEEQRATSLRQLQDQYETSGESERMAGLEGERKALESLMRVYGPLAKQKDRRTGFNPVSGRLQFMDTGEEVTPPPNIPPQAIAELEEYLANEMVPPQYKEIALRNFQRQFKVDPRQILQGGM